MLVTASASAAAETPPAAPGRWDAPEQPLSATRTRESQSPGPDRQLDAGAGGMLRGPPAGGGVLGRHGEGDMWEHSRPCLCCCVGVRGEGLVVCTAVTAPRSQVGPRQLCPGSFRGSPGGVCAGRWGRARDPRDRCVTRRQQDAFSWAGMTCRGTQVGLDCHLRFITTVATWATETFVLSLKLVKSYDLGIAEMCASPTFKCLLCF